MALWGACYDWNKGSALVSGGQPEAVGPASGWNGSTVLRGHLESLMRVAVEALEVPAVAATGFGLRFAAGDDWLAARLANPALVRWVLLASTVEEYYELLCLMEGDDCVWVQVGKDDWAADQDLAEASAWGEALGLMHPAASSVMLDVEDAPARVLSTPQDDRMDARVYGMRNGLSVRRVVGILPATVFFAGVAGVGKYDLDEVLGGKGKLISKWANSIDDATDVGHSMEVSEDDVSSVEEHLELAGHCDGPCGEKIDTLEPTFD